LARTVRPHFAGLPTPLLGRRKKAKAPMDRFLFPRESDRHRARPMSAKRLLFVEKPAMKYAICNELFEGIPTFSGLQMACQIGYTGLEVAPFTLAPNVSEVSEAQRVGFRNLVESFGMEIIGLHWLLAKTDGFHLTTEDATTRNRTAAYLSELVGLCGDLGGKVMVLGSPLQRNFSAPMTHTQAAENARRVIEQMVPVLESSDVRLAIEPLGPQEGNFLNHASQARALIEAIDSPWVRLHLDVKAMSTEGRPIESVIRDNADLMIHFHANDPNRLGPGMGDVDQQPIFQSLVDIGYEGWVSVEVFDYAPGIQTILQQSMDTMTRCVRNAVT
jgi:sugar phosphate isomerase/epimerase